MRPFLLFCLLALVSCGAKKSKFSYGTTTVADLVQEQGEPLKKEAIPVPQGEVYHYADNVKYQIKGDVVTAGFKDPVGDEKNVLYWMHRLKDCPTKTKELPRPKDSHTPPEIEFSCDEEGISVIYTQGSPTVSRVIEYAKK